MNHTHVTVLILGFFCVAANAADRVKTLELVLASRVDLPLVGLLKEAIRARLPATSSRQMACYQNIPDDTFQEAAVDYFATALQDADIAQALAFYATPVGRKLASGNQPDKGQPPPIALGRREYEKEEAFSLTRAGHELLAPNGLLQSPQVKQRFEALFADLWRKCGAPPAAG